MTDGYDEMRVQPDPVRAEALRRELHARMANVSRHDDHGRSHFDLDTAGPDPDGFVPMKEMSVSPGRTIRPLPTAQRNW